MAGMIECKSCGFDLATLPASLRMDPKEGGVKNLSCPLCGKGIALRVQTFGILVRGTGASTSFARWRVGAKDDATNLVKIGRFTLRFDSLGTIEPRDVCYGRVPAFVDENGKLVVPTVPIRTEFFDVVDEAALRLMISRGPIGEIVGSQYQVKLPLRGLTDLAAVSIQILAPEPGQPTKDNAFRHLNLRMWPNLSLSDWKYYLVGVASIGPDGESILRDGKVRTFVRTRSGEEWRTQDGAQRNGTSVVHVVLERPAWIALEIVDPSRPDQPVVLAGGIFPVPEATTTSSKDAEAKFGLDFGTSNTCVAIDGHMTKSQAGPELLPPIAETDWNLYLLRGGPESLTPSGPDLWPPSRGFGPMKDLFPSELLFSRPKRDLTLSLSTMEQWRLGHEFGIPAAGVTLEYSEEEFTLGDFKWRDMLRVRAPMFAPHTPLLQAHYIGAVLMIAYVRAAISSGQAARIVNVLYSYPMAFNEGDLLALYEAAERVVHTLQEQTGLAWTIRKGIDESTSAARNVGDPGANIMVYLDMGGGSTDIGIKLERRNDTWDTVYLTSVAYAGSDLLAGYVGKVEANGSTPNSCLAGKTTLDVLRRRVRESTSAKEVLGDPTLFKKTFDTVIERRTRHFYGYLTEYVARLLAAGFLDQRFRTGPDDKRAFPEEVKVAFFFLGNGWRFASSAAQEVETLLAQQIFDRTIELVGAEKTEYAKAIRKQMTRPDRINFVVGALDKRTGIPHPKAAVALGVLRGGGAGGATEGEPRSGIVGWTTKADGDEIPWFAQYSHAGSGGPNPPDASKKRPGRWDEDEPPPAPRAQSSTPAVASRVACASCGATNAAGARFCSGCGTPVAAVAPAVAVARFCSGCGAKNDTGARFCSSCGAGMTVTDGDAFQSSASAAAHVASPNVAGPPLTPWYRKISSEARLDWVPETMVLPDSLRQPDRLDRDLNQTRPALKAQCRPGPGEWFTKGAFEVTLEVLFKNKLGEIA